MAVAVKTPWRNSACLMFMAGPFRFCRLPRRLTKPLVLDHSPYIQQDCPGTPQPELLFVKRHSKSGFMASTHVFPGGVVEKADYSPNWLPLFADSSHAHPFTSITSLKPRSLSIYKCRPNKDETGSMAGEVALRICAIRELFEEAGVLLVRDKGEVPSLVGVVPGTCSPVVRELPQPEAEEWRRRVCGDAREFITLCRELNCVPDIWSLLEWSNWLTPRNYKRRYDTVFFMCFLQGKRPQASPDLAETTSVAWLSPSTAEDLFRTGKAIFAPPHLAEIKQLERIGSVPLLHSLALHRSVREGGVKQRKSTRIRVKDDVMLSVTENDDLSPLEGPEDWITPIQHPQSLQLQKEGVFLSLSLDPMYELTIPTHTAQELRNLSQTTDRIEFSGITSYDFVSSVKKKELEAFLSQAPELGLSSKL